MRPIQQTYNIETADPNGVVTAETPVNNVALTLDGAYTSGGVATFPFPTAVTFTSTSNLSTVTFTVIGTDTGGVYQTEAIVGPNNNTVTGTKTFKTVTSITVATATTFTTQTVDAGGADVGIGNGPWWPLDIYVPNQVTTISANILASGSATYSVQYTNEDVFNLPAADCLAVAHPASGGAFTSASTDQTHFTTTLMRAVRVNVASGSGQLRITVVQQSTA
jgi:hypothetical protein